MKLYFELLGDVSDLLFDVFSLSVTFLDTVLVGENYEFVILLGKFLKSWSYLGIEDEPVVSVFGELGSTFSCDKCVIHIEGGNFG